MLVAVMSICAGIETSAVQTLDGSTGVRPHTHGCRGASQTQLNCHQLQMVEVRNPARVAWSPALCLEAALP